jgi:hypothetical protein
VRLTFLGFWFCLLVAATARAAPPVDSEAKTSEQRAARDAFERGESAFKAAKYEVALAAFREAFSAVAHDAVRFNIAVCLERLGRYGEAAEQYDAAAKSRLLGDTDRERAQRSAQSARAMLGTLIVEAGRAGTRVNVDNVERCRIPCRVALDPGRHQVSIGDSPQLAIAVERGREHVMVSPESRPDSTAAKPEKRQTPSPAQHPVRHARGPGWLTWTGGALAVAGSASTLYFGLRTQSLHDDYVSEPTRERFDDGRQARLATNVSIGVAAVGAVLIAVDLLLLAPRERTPAAVSARRPAGRIDGCFEW